ncbi:hypothetical protein B0T24DRAFT_307900 [Lasiosphaeria ovina]|uniref:Uncharacterized protein n=1 Tax=Lasiosphaeria ovina TaxID=92902 RepID=A0AAE0N5P3_9PEZI|nr:hypothetical protein B0T24DRAFT_307900 [Lasiosphaeria ovina]
MCPRFIHHGSLRTLCNAWPKWHESTFSLSTFPKPGFDSSPRCVYRQSLLLNITPKAARGSQFCTRLLATTPHRRVTRHRYLSAPSGFAFWTRNCIAQRPRHPRTAGRLTVEWTADRGLATTSGKMDHYPDQDDDDDDSCVSSDSDSKTFVSCLNEDLFPLSVPAADQDEDEDDVFATPGGGSGTSTPPDTTPGYVTMAARAYQLEMLEKSLRENIIVAVWPQPILTTADLTTN